MRCAKMLCFILALVVVATISGCAAGGESGSGSGAQSQPSPSQPPESSEPSRAVSVTDMNGRLISLDQPATRVVVLTAADCEIVYALGAGDVLVGRGEYCDYPAQTESVQVVQSGAETNIEQIIALEPQVVVMSGMAQTEEQSSQLENAGITVAYTYAQDIEGVYEAISLIGAIVDKDAEAAALVGEMRDSFAEIADASKDMPEGKTIYFEVSPLEWGLWTAGSDTFMDEIANMLGLANIFADVSGWAEISQEQIIERNPDYIVTVTMYYGEGVNPVDEILARDGWQNIEAVKNENVFHAGSDEITRPGPRLVDATRQLHALVTESLDETSAPVAASTSAPNPSTAENTEPNTFPNVSGAPTPAQVSDPKAVPQSNPGALSDSGTFHIKMAGATYPVNTDTVAVNFINDSSSEEAYGFYYRIEYLNGTQWEIIPLDFMVFDIAGILNPGESNKETFKLYQDQHSYKPGLYKISILYEELEAYFILLDNGAPDKPGEVYAKTLQARYPANAKTVQAAIVNDTQAEFDYGLGYAIERYNGAAWEKVPITAFVPSIGCVLEPGGAGVETYDLHPEQYDYQPGRYRLSLFDGTVTAEFELA